MVDRARGVSVAELLNVKPGTRIPCPFHQGEHKNMVVKDFAYCFVCNESADAIKWVMTQEGMGFAAAVRRLNR